MKNKDSILEIAATKKKNAGIYISGARVHNLKNVTVEIPRNKLIVVTGVSGSGKSSLTIDTLYAEGQRKYAESLNAYVRQFLNRMDKPDVDYIHGLCPAIAIEQKVITRTPRSTVGSMTEIYDYLKLLYARIGRTYSPVSGLEVKKDDVGTVLTAIKQTEIGNKVFILAPFVTHVGRNFNEELNILLQKGFNRLVLITGKGKFRHIEPHSLQDVIEDKDLNQSLNQYFSGEGHNLYILVDRLVSKIMDEDDEHRLTDSISTAFYEGLGSMQVAMINSREEMELHSYNNRFERDGITFEEPSPNLFSFNNPYGACPVCEGFGQVLGIDKELVLPDKRLSVYEGAVAPWKGEKMDWWRQQFVKGADSIKFPIHKPIADLSPVEYNLLWTGKNKVYGIHEFFKEVEQNLYKVQYRVMLSRYRGRTECTVCNGYRLRGEALYVKINDKHIGEVSSMPVIDMQHWFNGLDKALSTYEKQVAKRVLIELQVRLKTLTDVGLSYLSINRLANTLSGGESQRIQLTRSLGNNLTDSLYILDEPSIGLHSSDTENLIRVLKELRELGNTIVVVEHDELIMREADYIIDMGPLASHLGGEVVAAGHYNEIVKNNKSLTGKYLSGFFSIEPPANVRKWNRSVTVEGARHNNLKNVTVTFPLNTLTVVSGVSGSGKTTLVKQILFPALRNAKGEVGDKPGFFKKLTGDIEFITAVEMVDQNPIGKSSRSNPVTYIKLYDEIRDLFSKQPLSKMRGFQPKHFSFNVDGGRCDTCKGEGEQVIEMQFLADVHLVCESCGGKRFKEEVLEVEYKGKNIFNVLEMSVDEAIEFFESNGKEGHSVAKGLQPLSDVGLGYIKLGQSSDTLSGGEAQRVKLASYLGKGRAAGKIFFIFDEPTTGLHFHDIKKLLASFNALIEQGHSILVIEHNIDVIKSADWLIELGPGAGDAGGELIFEGKPAEIKKRKNSKTAKFL